MRVTLLEDPGTDPALSAVRNKLSDGIVEVIQVVHNSDPSSASMHADIVGALKRIEPRLGSGQLESIDLVGHGESGRIRLGATTAKTPKIRTSEQTEDWALLDCDVNKLEALAPMAERLASWRARGYLAASFQIRLVGCNTALDPDAVAPGLPTRIHDGSAFIHLLASFFDCPVAGSLGYVGPEAFDAASFSRKDLLRSCVCDRRDGRVTFDPTSVTPTDRIGESVPVASATATAEAEVRALLDHYAPEAHELGTKWPLAIRDGVIRVGQVTIDLVEDGRAILIRKEGRIFRSPARAAIADARSAVIRYLGRVTRSASSAPQ